MRRFVDAGAVDGDGSEAHPYRTIQEAIDDLAASVIHPAGATIQVADGVYHDPVEVAGPWMGLGLVWIEGNTDDWAKVLLHTTDASAIYVSNSGRLGVRGVKLQTHGTGSALQAESSGSVFFEAVDFGPTGVGSNWIHLHTRDAAKIKAVGDYRISGGAWRHASAIYGSAIEIRTPSWPGALDVTVELVNNPAFADCFAAADHNGVIEVKPSRFVGTATGRRFRARRAGVMNTGGGGLEFLPGDVPGIVDASTFGLYY